MTADPPADQVSAKKRRRNKNPQLRVVFDTNALYVTPNSLGSASDLVRQEIATLIHESKYPDLDIMWYLPEVVRHERQYQMQAEALKLRPAINRIERLLGHNLALTDQVLLDHVKTKLEEKATELGLQELALDHSAVDWPVLIRAAEYRKPPFEPGEKEKGFRDALVAESFLQLVEGSPKTATSCRVVLVTSDSLLTQCVEGRISGSTNASVLPGIEELKGLINTLVSNVGEDFIAQLKPKAARSFFVSGDQKDVLFFKENIVEKIEKTFAIELKRRPEGTTFRSNRTWTVNRPNFSRKDGRRIFWTSRIEIEFEAGVTAKEDTSTKIVQPTLGTLMSPTSNWLISTAAAAAPWQGQPTEVAAGSNIMNLFGEPASYNYAITSPQKRIATHKGTDTDEVVWSAELTMNKDLKKAAVEAINHVKFACQPISSQ